MKKKYIIAIILIIIGLVICLITYPKTNFRYTDLFGNYELASLKCETYELKDAVKNIEINEDISSIEIIAADENKVVFYEDPEHQHSISLKDGNLKIDCSKNLYHNLINLYDYSIVIYVKEKDLGALNIKSTHGCVRLYSELNFNEVDIESQTGSISLDSNTINNLEAETKSGNIEIRSLKGNKIALETSSGNISIKTLKADKELDAESKSGNITFSDVDAKAIEMTSISGNIKGSIVSEMDYKVSSTTGLIEVPESIGNNRCNIKTTSGNIIITR